MKARQFVEGGVTYTRTKIRGELWWAVSFDAGPLTWSSYIINDPHIMGLAQKHAAVLRAWHTSFDVNVPPLQSKQKGE